MSSEERSNFEKRYEDLKSSLVRRCKVSSRNEIEYANHLRNLKMRFGKDISSVRRLDAAKDVKDLIRLLEKRLLVGWFNVEKFHEVINEFELDDFLVADHEEYQNKLSSYKLKHPKAFLPPPYNTDLFGEVSSYKDVIPQKVTECISTKMGSDWRFFAREMISEGLAVENDFDILDKSSDLSPQEKTERLLELFVRGDKRSKRSQLAKLLKNIHRNDLEEEVTELFLENRDDE